MIIATVSLVFFMWTTIRLESRELRSKDSFLYTLSLYWRTSHFRDLKAAIGELSLVVFYLSSRWEFFIHGDRCLCNRLSRPLHERFFSCDLITFFFYYITKYQTSTCSYFIGHCTYNVTCACVCKNRVLVGFVGYIEITTHRCVIIYRINTGSSDYKKITSMKRVVGWRKSSPQAPVSLVGDWECSILRHLPRSSRIPPNEDCPNVFTRPLGWGVYPTPLLQPCHQTLYTTLCLIWLLLDLQIWWTPKSRSLNESYFIIWFRNSI